MLKTTNATSTGTQIYPEQPAGFLTDILLTNHIDSLFATTT